MTRTALLITLAHLPAAPFAQSFQGLGDLPGGSFYSQAFGVSADGSVVVGGGNSALGAEAFRWTAADGLVGLGDLPGDDVDSRASAASADGSVVVGEGKSAEGREAFRWTAAGGMVGLGDVPGGSFSSHAHGVSADGSVVAGEGSVQAFRWTVGGGMQGLGNLPGGDYSAGYGVSGDGNVVVGQASVPGDGWEAFRWTAAGGMAGLGVLPGADVHQSTAYAASADGSVIVGVSRVAGAYEAFRWTAAGMKGLGDLPGGQFNSTARGVSADGTVIVGEGSAVGGGGAFVWTPAEGMRSLREILVAAGVNLDGWVLTFANAVSADGTVIVGSGRNPQGQTEAWRAELPSLRLITPAAGSLLVGGENVRIRWAAPASVDLVALTLLPDTLGGAPVTIDFGLAAADTAYVWAVPDTLFSRSARIAIEDMEAPALADTSGAFRVKPYHLTRLSAGGARYEPFRPDRHGWPFGNTQAALFPPQWYGLNSFDYADGLDPFTDDEYDDDFPTPPINARPDVFPDWPAYVRAFGTDAAYWAIVPGVEAWYRDAFVSAWGTAHVGRAWGGSCYGLATSSLLAFCHREAFGAAYPDVGPVEQLHTVPMSVPVREAVNTQYVYQFGRLARDVGWARLRDAPRAVLADLKAALLADTTSASLGILSMKNVTRCAPFEANGGHAVTAYRLERDPSAAGRWRVYIYDSNRPADTTAVVLVDSMANQWAYGGGLNWGGRCGLFLRDPIANYLQPAQEDPAGGALPAGLRDGGGALYVAATPGADVVLASAEGGAGYVDGAAFNTLDDALPDVPDVGGPTPPVGYAVPGGTYTLSLADAPDERLQAYVLAPGALYAYGRADAEAAHTDRLAYDPDGGLGGALTAASDDAGATKVVTLRAVLPGDPERTLDAAEIPLTGPDSVRFAALDHADGPRLRLDNEGGAKTYTLRLRQADASGGARFRHAAVPLAAGATHTVRPDWSALGDGPVEVDVDLDGDGVPDEVLVLDNQPVAAEPGAPEGVPEAFALHGPSPNPSSGRVALRYDVPESGRVRLAVYDLLGREVAVLVDGERQAGRHEAALDGARLAAGLYLVRLMAAGARLTRRVTILR